MELNPRFRILIYKWTDASRLCARKELADDADRLLDVEGIRRQRVFGRRSISRDVETSLAVGEVERTRTVGNHIPLNPRSNSRGVPFFSRFFFLCPHPRTVAGPELPRYVVRDLFISDAGIVNNASLRRFAQLAQEFHGGS